MVCYDGVFIYLHTIAITLCYINNCRSAWKFPGFLASSIFQLSIHWHHHIVFIICQYQYSYFVKTKTNRLLLPLLYILPRKLGIFCANMVFSMIVCLHCAPTHYFDTEDLRHKMAHNHEFSLWAPVVMLYTFCV